MGMDADLVLEGGGVKGIALVGAISVLEERGFSFRRVAGTSAGAIVGALTAAGMPAATMTDVMRDLDYAAFRDTAGLDRLGPVGRALSFVVELGIYEGDHLRKWLTGQLAAHGVTSFRDLRDDDEGSSAPPGERYRFVAMASDISAGCLRRLPWDYHHYDVTPDDVPVADAVRASMSIPYYYEPVKLRDTTGRQCVLVDGGMLSNFPIDVFDRTDGRRPRWPTLGIKLSARPESIGRAVRDVGNVVSMGYALVSTMMSFHDQMHIDDPDVLSRTIFVDTMGVSPIDFDIDEGTRQALYDNGRAAATRFLDGDAERPAWDFASYLAATGRC
jgi:NTE family protein